ncbi:hypothetical protein J8I87_17685 [Paraburkholderia sp. LEh10]|uniref:hypothetical protein n=1 Tax=Paraburkholderia sp. LEh10 TaxID=2821353 RepID=UPI001AE59DAE|nr:hypothetical protein [Paraburkholderia sp. LEh10]MBP0591523.1 hypothetical protein [Paraburkholderia sp. LEh10]
MNQFNASMWPGFQFWSSQARADHIAHSHIIRKKPLPDTLRYHEAPRMIFRN